MPKVRAVPVNAGQNGEFYVLINSNDGDVLRAPNHWKTQRGAERWAEKNGFSVVKPVAKPAKPKAKTPAKPKAKTPAKPAARSAVRKPQTPKKSAAPKKAASQLPKSVGFVEKNAYGAYVVYGDIGIRRYMGYTKKEALARYNAEAKGKKK